MTTHLQKWGNSIAIRLPKELLRKARLEEGRAMFIETRDGEIILKPAVKTETLQSLLGKITHSNRHAETDWGNPVGKEIW